ncbi:lipocalin-like domain-containing protein [Tropicimonas sp. IMCC6043]|uniref:lipocalin-like domain-containing protein n=1 Tax=Tropicimonas sp. IMCC6043 TaxID=2510645 RepID=UPI00101C9602|nr:lipocalin-like domain-containing protein [Tropicimonas sp. IMCC6043]RYH10073.1 iron ABC transporter permease [Tropicimonas sp. IMCC6043]
MNGNLAAACLLCLPTIADAQGFAGLGSDAVGFALPDPAHRLTFPEDHGAHPAFRIEWWYLTANLTGPDGTDYGIQWTLFRSALAPFEEAGWASPQIWLGNAGLTTPTTHFAAEKLARGGTGQAGVETVPFAAWIDDWRMAGTETLDRLTLSASAEDFGYELTLNATGPLVPQGEDGYSVKSAGGQASHYYSQPFYEIAGTISLPEGDIPVTGQGWLDREWSSQPLADTQDGWDWISLHFDSGAKLMGFRLRDRSGPPFTSATWISTDGTPTPYSDGELTMRPLATTDIAGAKIPTRWQIDLPAQALSVEIDAINPNAWMDLSFPYWEGPVRITGNQPGRGYLEMTGYAAE